MIDWLTLVAPCLHSAPITGGQVMSISPGGDVEWVTLKRASLRGSFDASITIRSATHTPEPCTHVEVSGNPIKWLQGHNLWGSDDLPGLVFALLSDLALRSDLPLTPTADDRHAWRVGCVGITRVDIAEMFHLANRQQCLAFIRAAHQSAHLAHRGRGELKGDTLYFGKRSRRSTLKLYAKGQEISEKGHRQAAIDHLPHAKAWADRSLRAELTLRSMKLKDYGLHYAGAWDAITDEVPFSPLELLRSVLGGMTMTTNSAISQDALASLRPALRTAAASWEAGTDLRAILPRPTFYKYRKELLPFGIDIAVVQPKEVSNVVPLVRILEAKPVGVPDWAVGTPLYFEPPRRRTA